MKNLNRLFTLAFIVLFSGFIELATGVHWAVPAAGIVVLSQFVNYSKLPMGALFSAVDISGISKYANQFQKPLINTLVNGLDVANDILVMPNIKSRKQLAKLTVGKGFKPYSNTKQFFTGDLAYTERELLVNPGKREIEIDVEDYRDTYLAQVLMPGSAANKDKVQQIPFAAWTMQKVIERVQAEINDATAYDGFDKADAVAYSEIATYSVGEYVTYTQGGVLSYFKCIVDTSAGEDPDDTAASWQKVDAEAVAKGIGTILAEEIAGSGITEVAIGAITDGTTALAAHLELFRSMPPAYKRSGCIIHSPYTDYEFLMDGIMEISKYTREDLAAQGYMVLPKTGGKCIVKPSSWQPNSRRLICEPMAEVGRGANLVLGTDLLSDSNQITTFNDLWVLQIGIKVVIGFQIQDLNALKIGDQA